MMVTVRSSHLDSSASGRRWRQSRVEYAGQTLQDVFRATFDHRPDHALKGRIGGRSLFGLGTMRDFPRDHRRTQSSLGRVIGRLDLRLVEEAQQIAPLVMTTE